MSKEKDKLLEFPSCISQCPYDVNIDCEECIPRMVAEQMKGERNGKHSC